MTGPRPLGLGEATVSPGSHLLGFFSDPEHLDMPALRYLEAGLVGGERCLWLCSDPDRARHTARRFGPAARRFVDSEAFTLASFRDLYFPGGAPLDAAQVSERWGKLAGAAEGGGFTALRIFAEVDVDSPAELAQMLEYEATAGEHLHVLPVIAACLYPRAAMSADALRRLRQGHDVLVRVEHGPIMLFETHAAHD